LGIELWLLPVFFLCIAFVYASVGFGGGSSYLAVLAMYAFPFQEMKLTALICNIIVVTGGTVIFYKRGELNLRKVIPLVCVSVPMAYAGARLRISQDTFFLMLSICLIAAGILLWLRPVVSGSTDAAKGNIFREAGIGGLLGFVSGMVGIGGGIFLAPVLNLLNWDSPKRIAATASFFILINSMAGIAGQLSVLPPAFNFQRIIILAVAVLIGGQLGARLGAGRFSQVVVRRVTAVLVFTAGIEVFLKHFS
jgi:uncharacterized protein